MNVDVDSTAFFLMAQSSRSDCFDPFEDALTPVSKTMLVFLGDNHQFVSRRVKANRFFLRNQVGLPPE
jgi:hypothetical protein